MRKLKLGNLSIALVIVVKGISNNPKLNELLKKIKPSFSQFF